MNLNDFVVLPNNKAKSVKLNARNLQELQMETVSLANESKEMEEKLRQLKDSMSKEKEDREQSGRFRWTSGQCGSLSSNSPTNSSKKNKENKLQKLSEGKLKIRVLKDEPLTAPPLPPPPLQLPTSGLRRKNRLKGTICGQCEIKTAGLMCAECTENYCIGCFARFHQKGALKLHRMIPIQTDLQTHVSTREVVSCFQRKINPSSHPRTFTSPNSSLSATQNSNHIITSNAITRRGEDESPEKGSEVGDKHMKLHLDDSEVLVVNHGEEKTKVGRTEDDNKGFPSTLLSGEYNEEESASSFQEALRHWRGENSDRRGEETRTNAMWIPVRPVSVSAMATQADLPPDREAEGQRRGGREERLPVKVEFKENSLIHMDRLRLKKHRRTPTETYHPPVAFGTDLKSQPNTNTEKDLASNLTAEEEDFRRYYATLFTAPVSRGRTEPQITPPESCLVIEFLDETCGDKKGICAAELRTDNNRELPSVQQIFGKGKTLGNQTALDNSGSLRVSHSSPGPTQPSRQYKAQPKTAQKLHSSKPQTSRAERTVKSLPSKSKPSTCPTAETSRTSEASIKTPTSQSPRSILSPTIHKSKANCGSPQLLSSLPHSQSQTPLFFADVFASASNSSPVPEEDLSCSPSISFPLRSTFTVSPSNSTDPTLLPKVYHSAPLQEHSNSSLFAEQSQSSQLFAEPISSPQLCESQRNNLMPRQQSQHFSCDQESVLLDNQLQLPLSPVSASPHPSPKSLEPSLSQITLAPYEVPAKTLSSFSLLNEPPPDVYSRYRSTPTYGDKVFMSPVPMSGDHKSTLPHRDTHRIPSSHFLNVIQNLSTAVKMEEEEEELLIDSEDEMSSDSLGLASREEDSSDKEAQMQGRLTRERSTEEQENSAISHLQDSFVPAEAERQKYSRTDKPEQLSEPSMVIHNQSAGFRSQQFCDLDGFLPQGLDMHTGHSDTPEDAHCDPIHTCQSSLHDSDPTENYRASNSLRISTEKHLGTRVMKDNPVQPTGIQIHSTKRRETSANGLGASEFGSAFRPLSRAAREIMEICGVDQRGCEDPDLDIDTTEHTVHHLAQELRLIAKETGTQAQVISMRNSESQDQHWNLSFKRTGVSEEQKEEEEAAKRDQQSVLLLP